MLLKKDRIDTIAIGGFDGIHLGHLELIKKLGKNGALVVIDKDNANLTPMSKRVEYSKYPCMFYHFDKIKSLSGEEFLKLLKKEFVNLKKIVVGYDFVFGAGRSCDISDLKTMFDGEVYVVEEYFCDGISVHSSTIREMLKKGDIYQANRLLGREYSIVGNVIKGQGLGKKELYPTLNLNTISYLLPKNGVYATKTIIDKKIFPSVSFVGLRLSIDQNFSIETHILDKTIIHEVNWVELVFIEFLRENRKFDTLAQLKVQISKDIKKAKSILT